MVDLLSDLNARLWGQRVPTELAPLVIVVAAVEAVGRAARVAFWEVHLSDLEVVLRLPGGVGAEQQAVDRVGLIRGPAERQKEVKTR